jgi:hypothetical protein
MAPRRGAFRAAFLFVVIAISLSAVRPLWVDEILQLIETRRPSPTQMMVDIQRIPGAVPLGFLVQQAGLRITGYSIVRARWTPVLFGGASVYVVVLLATEVGLVRPWLAGAMFAAFPLTLRYATESRVYSQALFFSVLATLLHVRLTKRPGWGSAAGSCLALIAAVYTQPYAALVGVAHVLWSLLLRNWKSALLSAVAFCVAAAAFLPWFLRSSGGWAAGIASTAIHFHISAATPLMIFRESIGAGYWGGGCLVLLCAVTVRKGLPTGRAVLLFVLIAATVVIGVLTADARFNYFLAARQFLWMLPSLAILAAMSVERAERMALVLRPLSSMRPLPHGRGSAAELNRDRKGAEQAVTALVLAGLLVFVCGFESSVFFLRPREDWQSAADSILEQVHRGASLVVVPSKQAPLYTFFHPELSDGGGSPNRIVMAVTPSAAGMQGRNAIAAYIREGYELEHERFIGGSRIVSLCRRGP